MIPNTGNNTAVIKKAAIAAAVLLPAFCPKNGGKIKFPAPKNIEKSIKLTINNCLLVNFITFSSHKKTALTKDDLTIVVPP